MAGKLESVQRFLGELRRRKVFQVTSLYAVTMWGASLGAAELMPAFGAPDWAVPAFVICALLGLPVVVALSWVFELSGEGIVRDQGSGPVSRNSAHAALAAPTANTRWARGRVVISWQDLQGSSDRSFTDDFRIGRDTSCELRFDDPLVSRHHARVSYSDGIWWIEDLGSRNGTLLDGRRIDRAPLPPSAQLRLYDQGPLLRIEVAVTPDAQTLTASRFRKAARRSSDADRT